MKYSLPEPKSVDDLYGLSHIKKALKNIEPGTPIMFIGGRGQGKTTLAHILAKQFADSTDNIRDINCGRLTNKADMEVEIENLKKSSLFGKRKVLILDEVQQLKLSQPSQNAWLRELDPDNLSKNTLVMACTTNVESLLETFVRRFITLKVTNLTDVEASQMIDDICEYNNIDISKLAKSYLIKYCEGIPAYILSSFQKIVGVEDEEEILRLIETTKIEDYSENVKRIFNLLLSKVPWKTIAPIIKKELETTNPEDLRISLMNFASGYVMSNFFDEKKIVEVGKFYDSLIEAEGFPNKAKLILSLMKFSGRN